MTTSIRKRFAFTIAANLLRSLCSFSTGLLLAKWLGPTSFGNMAFLLGTFVALRTLLDLGSSTAFYTFMSQQLRERRFVRSFYLWLGAQFIIALAAIGFVLPDSWIGTIWHGESRLLIVLAFVAAFMQNSVWPVVQQAAESQRLTLRVQTIGIVVVAMHLLAVAGLYSFGVLGLYVLFAALAIEYFLAAVVANAMLSYAAAPPESSERLLARYFRYCLPLVPYAWAGFAYEFADRWLLQTYGGSAEQAYYAIGSQFAAIALLATASILNIFWKEIAEAHHTGDKARTETLYRSVSRMLFLVGAAIAGFLIPWAEDVLRFLLGEAYVGGASTLAIMFLYPVHQSMGQIGGTMLYATERVPVWVGIGIGFMCVSVVVSYLMLAPRDAPLPGLGLASTGLALKMVVLQAIQVNAVAFAIARLSGWRFDWIHQPASLLGCLGAGWLVHQATTALVEPSWPLPVDMAIAGAMYAVLVAILVFALPGLAGMTRERLTAEAVALSRLAKAGLGLR